MGQLERRQDVFGNLPVVNPGWYHRVDAVSGLLLAGVASYLLLRRLTLRRVPVQAAALLAVALWAVAQLASALHGTSLVSPRAVVLLLCLLAATALPRGRGACLGAATFGVIAAIAGGLLSVFRYDVAFIVPCQGACSGLGFTGTFANENLLGVVLAASIPFAYLGFRGRARSWLCLYLAGLAIATGSRTATLAAVIALVALFAIRPRLDLDRPAPRLPASAWLVLAGSVAGSVYVIRHHWDWSTLTTRPALWGVAWHYIHRSPWFGYGPERWASLYRSSEIPLAAQRTSHNQWTDVLFVAGGVGVALFVCVALATVWSARRARSGVLITLATILMIGTTEGAWSIGTLDLLSFSFVAFILIGASPQHALAPEPAPARGSAVVRRRAGDPRRGPPAGEPRVV